MKLEKKLSQAVASELGKESTYDSIYNPNKLFPISRKEKREEIGIDPLKLPFCGFDLWNHYEVSWLNERGKPLVALAEIIIACDSPNIIESKSMKLYFNSFNNTKIKDVKTLQLIVKQDLESRVAAAVDVRITPLGELGEQLVLKAFEGECLDHLDVSCEVYQVDASFLKTENVYAEEILFSDLLKSNCLVTNQPDWGSVQIAYKGNKINKEGLLKYLVSFRNHNEFHEQCIERIFVDVMERCRPEELSVFGRYTRRGGLDINPYRSTSKTERVEKNQRLFRQ